MLNKACPVICQIAVVNSANFEKNASLRCLKAHTEGIMKTAFRHTLRQTMEIPFSLNFSFIFSYDCADGSDERGCDSFCDPDEFRCVSDGSCIQNRYKCDYDKVMLGKKTRSFFFNFVSSKCMQQNVNMRVPVTDNLESTSNIYTKR